MLMLMLMLGGRADADVEEGGWMFKVEERLKLGGCADADVVERGRMVEFRETVLC
jgi:hypothetical protein